MKPTTVISLGDGMAKAKNPYRCEEISVYTCLTLPDCPTCNGCKNVLEFEHNNPPMPIFKDGEPFFGKGEVEAFEIWQSYDTDYKCWEDAGISCEPYTWEKFNEFFHTTRKIWQIVTNPKEKEPAICPTCKKPVTPSEVSYCSNSIHLTANKEKEVLTEDNFFEIAKFSDVPIVNQYFKDIKSIYHNGEIVTGIEKFALWLQNQFKINLPTSEKELLSNAEQVPVIKTADEVLTAKLIKEDECTNGLDKFVIEAMEEYANQFKQPTIVTTDTGVNLNALQKSLDTLVDNATAEDYEKVLGADTGRDKTPSESFIKQMEDRFSTNDYDITDVVLRSHREGHTVATEAMKEKVIEIVSTMLTNEQYDLMITDQMIQTYIGYQSDPYIKERPKQTYLIEHLKTLIEKIKAL